MKDNKNIKVNGAAGRGIFYGCIMAAMLSVSLPARAEEVHPARAENLMGVMVLVQGIDDMELLENQIQQIEDSTELDAEFSNLEEESVMIMEEVERQREEARRSKIWGAVIIVLVLGIFSMGIVPALKDKKEENMENTGTELRGKKKRQWNRSKEKEVDEIEIEDITG